MLPIQILIGQSHLYANSADPYQTPHYAVSDLDLHCLPLSHKKEARLIWANAIKK